ncbi:MAG: zinc ribbon domain-containing protein [Cyanobacteria bacterium SZAS LIN-3]|nr:zinc ribbon domain-containing protein [Cyanobacteria bacterium SZAS LIN-3]
MPDPNLSLLLAVGILSLILVLSSGMLIWQFISRGANKKDRLGRIPPNVQYFLSRPESMAVVRGILTNESIVGCRWRITYDRTEEGRIQARLFGNPVGGEGSVDILLNMIFHKLEPFKTELEWSYVVMAGQEATADRVVDSSNAAFKSSLRAAQFQKSSPAEKLLSSVTSAPVVGPGETEGEVTPGNSAASPDAATARSPVNGEASGGDGHNEVSKSCFNCHKAIEPGFAFCIYCGASVT